MEKREMWMPPIYSRGLVYTYELTSRAATEVDEETWAQLLGAFEEAGSDPAFTISPANRLDESRRDAFVRYCMELDFWHEDLDFLLFEMDTSVRYFHQDRLDLKRLSVIYHTDNFYFRIHAYREKVFKLVSVFLGLGIPDRDPKFNDKVFDELGRRGLGEVKRLLSDLSSDPMLVEAIDRRNRFVHRLAKRVSGILKSDERIYDYISGRSDSEKKDKITDLNLDHIFKLEEFGRICERLARFRDELVAAPKAL